MKARGVCASAIVSSSWMAFWAAARAFDIAAARDKDRVRIRSQQSVSTRQARIGERVAGVDARRLFERLDRLRMPFWGAAIPEIDPAQIGAPGIRIHRGVLVEQV